MEDGADRVIGDRPDDAQATPRIAVVGGGWAGCAAAVTLAKAGVRVALLEQAPALGGRARRLVLDGLVLDNGQHLLVGAYHATLRLLDCVHGAARARALLHRLPLTMRPLGGPGDRRVSLAAWRAPAPLHLAGAMLTAAGLGWRDRAALVRSFAAIRRAGFTCESETSVAELFGSAPPAVIDALWAPLCVAALNTPPARASARHFCNVLRAAFSGPAANSDFLVPATDLGTLFPAAAAAFVRGHAGSVRTRVTVRGVDGTAHGVEVRVGDERESYAAAIVAVGPHQLATALGGHASAPAAWRPTLAQTDAFAYESITTVYLVYDGAVTLPARMARLDDAPGQWVFDRTSALRPEAGPRTLLAVVVSANGPHDALPHPTLVAAVDSQLRRLAPGLPSLTWSRVIAERRATYACTPGLARPVAGRVARGVYLAGDYTDPEFPATLEAATRSGVTAARAALADLGRHID